MAHNEAAVVAYLTGELDAATTERLERHLVDCDRCWAAVAQDLTGRAAAESLRELAPPILRDRIRFAVQGEGGPVGRKARRRSRRAAVALLLILVAGAGAVPLGLGAAGNRTHPSDPASVAAVVRLAGAGAGLEAAPGVRLTVDGQGISVTRLDDRGVPVLVARSDRPFPMAVAATAMFRDDSPWVASRGQLNLVCVNGPHPVLVAAHAPADQLINLAVQLAH
jgi:anti-sigma factor RsiW